MIAFTILGVAIFAISGILGAMLLGWWLIDCIKWNAALYAEFYAVMREMYRKRRDAQDSE